MPKIKFLIQDSLDANLIYLLDSKGFYQPVYDFTININENINHIYICALK